MAEIKIKYEEVYSETGVLKTLINNDLMVSIQKEYETLQIILTQVDGAKNTNLKTVIDLHQQKAINTAQTIDKLLSFMSNSSIQVQLQEAKMANTITSGTRPALVGMGKISGGSKNA